MGARSMSDDEKLRRRALRVLATILDEGVKRQLRHGGQMTDDSIRRDIRDRDDAIRLSTDREVGSHHV